MASEKWKTSYQIKKILASSTATRFQGPVMWKHFIQVAVAVPQSMSGRTWDVLVQRKDCDKK